MPIDLKNKKFVVWTPNTFDLRLLKEVIKNLNGKFLHVKDKSWVCNSDDILAFIDEDNIDDTFFSDDGLLEKLEKLNTCIVIIGKNKKIRRVPHHVFYLEKPIVGKKQVLQIIGFWQRFRENLNKREQALTVKLNRLFYIYDILSASEYLYVEEVMELTKVSKRTILRDLKTLRDVLVTKEINYEEEEKRYFMQDIGK